MKAGLLRSPYNCEVFGGGGASDGNFPPANTQAYVDMNFTISDKYLGIYVPRLIATQQNNAGATMIRVSIVPEKQRKVAPIQFKPTGGGGGGQFNLLNAGQGVMIPLDSGINNATVQGQMAVLLRPVFVPYGFFLRCFDESNANQVSGVCYLCFDYHFITDPCTDLAL